MDLKTYQPSMVIAGHVVESPFIPDGSWAQTGWAERGDTNASLQPGRPRVYIVLEYQTAGRSGYPPLTPVDRPRRAAAAAGRGDHRYRHNGSYP